jgi:hypothetical protein
MSMKLTNRFQSKLGGKRENNMTTVVSVLFVLFLGMAIALYATTLPESAKVSLLGVSLVLLAFWIRRQRKHDENP